MSCNCVKRLCNRLIISESVEFTGGNLVIGLPAQNYNNCEKYCIVIAQTLPETATINAPVVFTIGEGTTLYSFVNCNGTPILASQVNQRTRYSVKVNTNVGDGVFTLLGRMPCTCCCQNSAASLPVAETVTP